jgi:ribonuclease R
MKRPRRDPHRKREAARYARPIASRELILARARSLARPLHFRDLAEDLGISDSSELDALRRRLRAMCRDGELMIDRRGRYGLVEKMNLVAGVVNITPQGDVLLLPDEGGDDVRVQARSAGNLVGGDRVLVRVEGVRRDGQPWGVVVELLERSSEPILGRYYEEDGVAFVEPERTQFMNDILIPRRGANPGDLVRVELDVEATNLSYPAGTVTEVLDGGATSEVRAAVVLAAHGIPRHWGSEVQAEAEKIRRTLSKAARAQRVDLTELPLVTIDGADARDFDDAVYCEPIQGGGWNLFVAIADVSHYVHPGTALDREARERGNSVYLPDYVVPMLPEILSNDLCSLRPDEPRLCMVCEMRISERGRLSRYQFYEGVMHSKARLTYDEVWDFLEHGKGSRLGRELNELGPHLENLHRLFAALRARRETRGALDFRAPEIRVQVDAEGRVAEIGPVLRNDAHRIIEECMIVANVAAARFIEHHELDGVFRIHEPPSGDKLKDLQSVLASMGIHARFELSPRPSDLQALLRSVANHRRAHVVETLVLRSLNQAQYSERNRGHFGLALPRYAHFTSPIRRYADLLVHRALKSVIRGRARSEHVVRVKGAPRTPKSALYPYSTEELELITDHISMTERRADTAVRDLEDWLKCEYIEQRVGDEFRGTVSGVTDFGLFVELDDLYVQGLVHVSALGGDYFHFDRRTMRLKGETTGVTFELGQTMTVQVARVDVMERKIDLLPADIAELYKAPRTRRRRGGRPTRGRGTRRK